MITILLIIVNAVIVQFVDLSSLFANFTWNVAQGWEVEEIERIRFSDYVTPISPPGGWTKYSCLVNLNIEEEPEWLCIIGGENAIVMLNSEGESKNFPVNLQEYRLIPEYSDDFILVKSPRSMSAFLPFAYLIDSRDMTERTVVSERSVLSDQSAASLDEGVGQFLTLLGLDGTVYFSDYQGVIGVNSPEHGLSVYTAATNTRPVMIRNHAISEDGELYVVAIASPGLIFGMNPEGLSWISSTPAITNLLDVSENGEIVVADEQMDGVIVFDGNTGQVIERYLRNKQISSLAVSANGNYIAVVVRDTPRTAASSPIKSIVVIDRSNHEEILLNRLDTCNLGYAMFLHQVTNDGIMLLEDAYNENDGTTKLHLITSDGQVLWTSEDINGSSRIDNEVFSMATTIASVEQAGNEVLLSYYNNNLQELVVIKIIESMGAIL